MAICSMTGFGRGEASGSGVKVVVELSSVNRKQFDCNMSLPRELISLEAGLHTLIKQGVRRGYIKGAITIVPVDSEGGAGGTLIDLKQVAGQVEGLRLVAAELGLEDDLSASSLLRLPDIWESRSFMSDSEAIWPLLEQAATEALQGLMAMREREGEAIKADLSDRVGGLRKRLDELRELAPGVPQSYQEVLQRRIEELLGDGAALDQAQLAREVAIFADRCDVSEELTRLGSHLDQFDKVMESGGVCGRTMDFLCQEIFREINTTGAKANDAAVAGCVIGFKAELEAIREQVQNLE